MINIESNKTYTMKYIKCGSNLLALVMILIFNNAFSQPAWKPVEGHIMTKWASEVSPEKPLPEYPRPQMVRDNWLNLNGLWDYAIKPKNASKPTTYDGKILVPFAVESALSGVGETVGKDSILWYKTSFAVPRKMRHGRLLLHFGAVDWQADVFVNGKKAGQHQGGYDPFTFDITDLVKSGTQELAVRVWDPTDDGPQPRGKQVNGPHGIWYTSVTGIWQTVWLEGVPETYIAQLTNTPDIDAKTIQVKADVKNATGKETVLVQAMANGQVVAEKEVASNEPAELQLDNMHLWSPTDPFLYDLTISVKKNGKTIDEAKSYFAMRKISISTDENGIQRMLLNNKFVFQFGPLDQGWWPDGLYTAPTDDALKFDIDQTKAMGFNMIRKHVKVEPARWYYHCDQAGMLVWQDMPSGDLGNGWESRPGVIDRATDKDRTAESEKIYKTEWNAIMDALHDFPCIVVWTPFNEAWGQFKTEEIADWTKQKDPSRLVNSASGGNFYPVGDIIDLHNYPEPAMPRPELFGAKRALVLGEFGGLGLPLEGHTWKEKDNWGYRSFKNNNDLFEKYSSFVDRLGELIPKGLSAAVYTQTTDVEVEVNGLMTYDRKVIKNPADRLHEVNIKLYGIPVGLK